MSAFLRENLSLQSKTVVFSRTLGGASGKKPACQSKKHNETQDQSPGSGRSPGGGQATNSSILAWEIPGTEEPGRLQSMGLQ